MAERVIGLDIGSSSIKAAQVLRQGDTYVVEHQAARQLPRGVVYDGRVDPAEKQRLVSHLREVLEADGFTTTDVIVGLNSSSAVFMEEMTLPAVEPGDADKSLPLMIRANNPSLAESEMEISYTVVGEVEDSDGTQIRVLVYSVRSDYAEEVARAVEEAGFNLVGADLTALALLRAVDLQRRPPRTLDAIVDIGANITVMLLHHNGVPTMLLLDPDSAGMVATDQIADVMGLDENDATQAEWEKIHNQEQVGLVAQARNEYAEALASRIANGLNSFLRSNADYDQLANVTLVGGGALLHGLGFYLRQALPEVPLSYAALTPKVKPRAGTQIQRVEEQSGGDYLAAIGLGTAVRI